MAAVQQAAVVVPVGGGRVMERIGLRKVPQAAFAGGLFVFEGTLEAGRFIPPHTHSREDEVTIVLSGNLAVDLDGRMEIASAGAYVIKPRGVRHAMWNHTDRDTRVVEIHSPGLMEPYYTELGALFAATDLKEPDRQAAITALHLRYGIVYHPDLIDEVVLDDGRRPQVTLGGRRLP
jgi:quercetin dioxygenase-like cupin family protein